MTRRTMKAKRMAVVAFLGAAATLTPISLAAPAQACVWDAAWFFLHQCNSPPPPDEPAGPPPPDPQIACDNIGPGGSSVCNHEIWLRVTHGE